MKKTALKPDSVLKDFWRDNQRFADLFNQVLFDGRSYIHPDKLLDKDTEESSIVNVFGQHSSITKSRDIIKEYADGVEFVLIGIENQMNIHYAMPVRTMLYDALRYTQQCKALERIHRKQGDLKTQDEFLSGITKMDQIKPVITLVVYYGEKDWDGPKKLSDMLEISTQFLPFFNDQVLHLLQAKDANTNQFKHIDNQDFFTIIQEFFNTGKIEKSKYESKEIYWETLAAIGAATGSQKLTNYAYTHKGGNIAMCTALENFEKEAVERGMQKGMQKGKINTFLLLYQDGTLDIETCAEKLNISIEEFEQLLKENEKTEN